MPNPNEEVHLYLDFNGAIYQVIRPELKTEESFIIHVLQYVDNIITIFNVNEYHSEDDSATGLGYVANNDQAQGTSGQMLFPDVSNDNDSGSSGTLHLFNPSSTTFVKHFIFRGAMHHRSHYAFDVYVAGYFNTTSAIDEVQFKPNTGTIDSGTIKMYGVL